MIDCVDIYYQPAFRHPLHKDHKLQMKPTNAPDTDAKRRWSYIKEMMAFRDSDSCPDGTVPIRRVAIREEKSFEYRYWPGELFTHLDECAMDLSFGGTVKNKPGLSYLLMGYGFFPSYNTFRSDYFKNIQYIGSDRLAVTPLKEQTFKSENSPECYRMLNIGSTLSGYTITYWGHSGQNC
ncbi:hypothetical protein MLD38_029065 [Melastoma candidum]|uniref:Uncharacterized protein n=1 Tax=Melastoma candidum TaxID=119954 RepID=A0ACB9N3G9_9MYRT|nr:hypothetical protein MLD38_029065 [Melastoma candidum]